MYRDEYLRFNELIKKANVSRSTLYRLIKSGAIKIEKIGTLNLYSYKDVINNKPRKNEARS